MKAWEDVAGYEGIYSISDDGDVMRVCGGSGARAYLILKPQASRTGYLRVGLWKDGTCKRHSVHRLVAAAFIGKHTNQINHKDGDKRNNSSWNLEYVTAKENINHAIKHGLRDTCGTKNHASKLDEEDVRMIRTCDLSGYALARKLGVTQRVISLVRRGLAWKHVV